MSINITYTNNYQPVYYSSLNSGYTENRLQLLLTNVPAVNDELLNLIMTYPGEIPFEPDFGTVIPRLLFEQPNAVNNWMIGNYLFVAVAKWLSFVRIDYSQTQILPVTDDEYYFKLVYSIDGIINGGQADFQFQT